MPTLYFADKSDRDNYPELKDILSGKHRHVMEIDAAEHDRVTSQIRSFPHLAAGHLPNMMF